MNEPLPKTESLLVVTGLNASFGQGEQRTEVLQDITFSVPKGKTIGVVGESGSGKSVTSLSIMRLIDSPPIQYESGEILFSQERIDLLNSDERYLSDLRGKRIAMIFQEPMSSLNPVHRCGAQVAEVMAQHLDLTRAERKARVLELFDEVSLPQPERIWSSYPHQLSGGQKQRVMIAMAMSCEPQLLICDEPTTALDVSVQRGILDLLHQLQKKNGMSMIFISHDLGVVAHISDEILVMRQGRLVEKGTSEQILNSPNHEYTRGLLTCRPPAKSRPLRLPTVEQFTSGAQIDLSQESQQERADRHEHMYAQEPLIQVNELNTWYPIKKGILQRTTDFVKAVNGVSFNIYKGETLGLVGESGCGKSTLGRTLVGLEKSTGGSISYLGIDLNSLTREQRKEYRRKVQIIFQDPFSSLNPRVRIGEAISEPMRVHGLYKNTAERMEVSAQLLERVGLKADNLNRFPHEFSGGQRQRVSIARTLALKPEVVICDESVSALDVSVQAQVLNLLNDLKEELGLTFLFISHDLSVVKYMSDRVMVMNKGLIEELQEADALYSAPKSTYAESLISATF